MVEIIVNDNIDEITNTSPVISQTPNNPVTTNKLSVLPPYDITNAATNVQNLEEDDADDDTHVRSRLKEDIFHRYQDIPYPQDCPIKQPISALIINATFKNSRRIIKLSLKFCAKRR